MVTSRDVARLAGVSQATVSRSMVPDSKVSSATRQRVQEAMEALGYVPHAGATAMKTSRTNTIGVVVADLTNPFFAEVLDEFTKVISEAGFRVIIWNTDGGGQDDALIAIRERAIDGVAFMTATQDSAALRAAVERASPIVLINRSVDGIDCDQVTSTNRAGGAAVASYLVENGRSHVAFIGGPPNASTARDRAEGFLGRMAELGHPLGDEMVFGSDFSHRMSRRITEELLRRPKRPETIFCVNDYMAFGALDSLRAIGLSAPRDCWVVGYDDIDMASWASFDLTTVRQPSREMARAGARMLVERIRSPDKPSERMEFPSRLIIRGSTAASRSGPLEVAGAAQPAGDY